ncbi:MAG: sterol desaturase family protein [Porphyrobacter sp.]|nr:sterol desaturase family protein [Porphyrobacter sp.]
MIQDAFQTAGSELAELLPLAILFGIIAYLTKRDALAASIRRARPEVVTNLMLLLVNAVVFIPLLAVPLLTGWSLLPRSETLVGFWETLPTAVNVVVAILLIEFVAYWRHRFEHSPSLWRVHATHHADEAMNWLSVRRKHPLGEALALIFDNLFVILLGVPFWAIAAGALIRGWWGYFIHADVPWTLGPLGKVFISPAAHRLHHIRDEQLMGHNFGNMITLWDRLFGTYRDPAPYLDCETGIAEGTRDFVGELARPFEARYWRKPGVEATGDQPA